MWRWKLGSAIRAGIIKLCISGHCDCMQKNAVYIIARLIKIVSTVLNYCTHTHTHTINQMNLLGIISSYKGKTCICGDQ